MGKLCRRRMLLAGLVLLCLLLPMVIAPVAQSALTEGVSFSGITLGVTAPEGDQVPQLLQQVMSGMSDVSQYCKIRAMEPEEAALALKNGDVTAVLELPEDFVQGILNGHNPDVTLIVREDRPLEALLTLWVGQSASDLLASFQNGIYAVLELYGENPAEGVSYDEVLTGINLRYINWTMNRQDLFRTKKISATEQLPIGMHYGLSLMSYLLLALAPLFMPVYQKQWLSAQHRFRAAGRTEAVRFFASLTACALVQLPITLLSQMVIVRGTVVLSIASALLIAVFCAAFGSLCCLLTGDTGSCGGLSFFCAVVFLALSGGILPPVMLPPGLRDWMALSPVTWLRSVAVMPSAEYDSNPGAVVVAVCATAVMTGLGWLVYRRRCARLEEIV